MLAVFMLGLGLGLAEPPQSTDPPPITLAAAVEQARSASPLRLSAKHLADGAAEAARFAGRLLNPFVDIRSENWGGPRENLPLDVVAVVSQPFELGGKREARGSVAASERDLAEAQLDLLDRQLALRTARLYVQALKARGLVDTLQANRNGLSTLIDSVRRRVAEGFSAEADLLRFETEAARVDIDMARAGLELDRSLNALALVIGAPDPIAASQLVEPAPLAPPPVETPAVTTAIARHPEMVAAEAHLTRARQASALERARRQPDPVVSAGYKRTAGYNTAVAGVAISLPVFGRNDVALARALGEEAAAAADREATARRLQADTQALIQTARTLWDRSERSERDLLRPAEAVRGAALATFREGTVDILNLIDAERVYADVQRTALELRLEALSAAIEARFALGEETLP